MTMMQFTIRQLRYCNWEKSNKVMNIDYFIFFSLKIKSTHQKKIIQYASHLIYKKKHNIETYHS